MPAGMMPTGMPVPASSAHTSRTVPSPPQTSTRSAPSTAARSAMPVPGSSMVVYCQVGSDQPDSRAIVGDGGAELPDVLDLDRVEDHREPALGGEDLGERLGVRRVERGRGSMKARARKKTARASSVPPMTSLGKWRPSRIRSRATSSHQATVSVTPRRRRLVTPHEQDQQHHQDRGEGGAGGGVARREAKLVWLAEGVLPVRPVAPQLALEHRGRDGGHRHHDDGQERCPALAAYDEPERQQHGQDRHADRAEGRLDHPQRVDEEGVVVRPVLEAPALAVEGVERGAVLGDEVGQDAEQPCREERPGQAAVAEAGVTCEVCPNRFGIMPSRRLAFPL